jgi:peptide-methionine (S)-S-oxide reductase
MMKRSYLFFLFLIPLLVMTGCADSPAEATQNRSAPPAPGATDLPEAPAGVVDIETVDERYDSLGLAEATFAGGCFWCTEAVFERVEGVEAVVSGYAGGSLENPTYEQVSSGATDHAESIRVYYDPAVIDYPTLLQVFFASHDPTQLNRQGPDIGPQYRSAIFYHDEEQRRQAEAFLSEQRAAGKYERPVVTELNPLKAFYKAEAYHQGYYDLHPNEAYIRRVSRPKVEKFMKEYPHLLKEKYKV